MARVRDDFVSRFDEPGEFDGLTVGQLLVMLIVAALIGAMLAVGRV